MSIEGRLTRLEATITGNNLLCECAPSFTMNLTPLKRGEALAPDTEETCQRCGRLRRTQHFTINLNGGLSA